MLLYLISIYIQPFANFNLYPVGSNAERMYRYPKPFNDLSLYLLYNTDLVISIGFEISTVLTEFSNSGEYLSKVVASPVKVVTAKIFSDAVKDSACPVSTSIFGIGY